jgi:signal transduction histidine kinase
MASPHGVTATAAPAAAHPPPGPAARLIIAAAGVALAACSLALGLTTEGVNRVNLVLLVWIGLAYVVAGLVAWCRRPDSRLGALMVAGGFAASLLALAFSHVAVTHTIGLVFDVWPAALFLHVYLAFPDGRLRSGFERGLVVAAYVATFGLQLVKMLLGGVGPQNLLEVTARAEAAETVERIQMLSIAALCLVAFGVLVVRRWRGGRPLRRAASLLIDSFALALVMLAVLFVSIAFQAPAAETIQLATFVVLGLSPIAFLIGLLDARLARSAIGTLFIELRADPSPAGLRDALARALRDPSLTLAYWLPQYGRWADADGRPVDLPEAGEPRRTTLIQRDGELVAALVHDPALDEEPELLNAVGAAAAIALENSRLQTELRARLAELSGSRARIVEAGQRERQRLERNLHDGAQQRLIALSLELSLLEERLRDDPEALRSLGQARNEIATSLEELRDVARGLHPAVVSGHGLAVALEQLAVRAPVPVRLSMDVEGRLPERLEVAAFYLVSESLANIGKHAHAASASVEVSRANGQVVIEVVDDGVGGADADGGTGLRGLADRVEALEGRLRIWSPSGGGTRLRAEIPCAS